MSTCEKQKWIDNESQQKDAKDIQPSNNLVTYILVFFNVVLMIIAVTVVVIWRTSSLPENAKTHEIMSLKDSLCLPCTDISLHKDDDFKREKQKDDYWMCCAEGIRHLDRLIEMFVEKWYREDKASERFCVAGYDGNKVTNKPAARVSGIAPPAGNSTDETIHWGSISFIHDNIEYTSNGRFRISIPGYYYLYTQVTLKDDTTVAVLSNNEAIVYHLVYKQNSKIDGVSEEKLLESFQSRCKLQTKQSNTTSYVGAVFKLDANDEIYVKVSHPERISQSAQDNYFGVHLI